MTSGRSRRPRRERQPACLRRRVRSGPRQRFRQLYRPFRHRRHVHPAHGIPTYSSVTAVPDDANTQWGKAVLQSGGYNYVYGSDISSTPANAFDGMKVARVPQGESLDTNDWTYWNGAQWVSGEANAVPDQTVTDLTGVAPQPSGNGYMAVSIPGWAGGDTSVDLSLRLFAGGPLVGTSAGLHDPPGDPVSQ